MSLHHHPLANRAGPAPPFSHLSRNTRPRSLLSVTAQAHACASRQPHDSPSLLTHRRRSPTTAAAAATSLASGVVRRRRRRPAAPLNAAAASSSRASVIEYLLLITARPDADPDELHEGIETVWSLQYMVPGAGVICASAGRVLIGGGGWGGASDGLDSSSSSVPSSSSSSSPAAAAAPLEARPLTHVVHFRLTNRAALERFVSHPLFAQTLQDTLGPLTVVAGAAAADSASAAADDANNNNNNQKGYAELVFEGCVDRGLEPMFRRGPDYEPGGVEQLWLLGPSDGGGDAASAAAFLARLGELAESSAAGAVQATFGPVIAASPPSPAITHLLMARFTALNQAAAFAALPPCAAISGAGPGGADAPAAARSLPLLARRRVLVRAGKLDDETENDQKA